MTGAMSTEIKTTNNFSDEHLIYWFAQLDFEHQVLSSTKSIEVAYLTKNGFPDATRNSTNKLPILLKALFEIRDFDLDGYKYTVESNLIKRSGPKVKQAPPKPKWQVHKIGGPPTS